MGYERTRHTMTALALSFFMMVFFFISLSVPPAWHPAFIDLSTCYLTTFLAISAEWFWGR